MGTYLLILGKIFIYQIKHMIVPIALNHIFQEIHKG